jgi:rhodanese-related sulfurtransferase
LRIEEISKIVIRGGAFCANKGIIAVYCKGGVRSKTAASQLAARGYKVVELRTGYDGWVKSGGKTEK